MAIQFNNVSVTYQRHPIIHQLSATIEKGELVAIVGPNGAGKSTLLNTLAGLTSTSEGSIDGVHRNHLAYLPQQTQLDLSFPMTVAELVATGLWQSLGFARSLTGKHQQQCQAAIAAVGLQGFEQRLINTLSGGQLQRSLFARVMLQDQPLILLDEPFNAIDAKTVIDLSRVIKSWHADTRTVLVVTHDLDYVREHCPTTLLLAREGIGCGETSSILTPENLERAKHLCEPADNHARWYRQSAA